MTAMKGKVAGAKSARQPGSAKAAAVGSQPYAEALPAHLRFPYPPRMDGSDWNVLAILFARFGEVYGRCLIALGSPLARNNNFNAKLLREARGALTNLIAASPAATPSGEMLKRFDTAFAGVENLAEMPWQHWLSFLRLTFEGYVHSHANTYTSWFMIGLYSAEADAFLPGVPGKKAALERIFRSVGRVVRDDHASNLQTCIVADDPVTQRLLVWLERSAPAGFWGTAEDTRFAGMPISGQAFMILRRLYEQRSSESGIKGDDLRHDLGGRASHVLGELRGDPIIGRYLERRGRARFRKDAVIPKPWF